MHGTKKIPLLGRMAAGARPFDRRRRYVRDRIALSTLVLAVYAWAHFHDIAPKLFQFAIANAGYKVDDLVFAIFLISIALAVSSWRRVRDLDGEVKALRTAETAAHMLARHDPLTGLPNRRLFNEKLDDALQSCAAGCCRAAVLMLDLNGFKAINNVYGYLAGDKALVEFAKRISAAAEGAFVARVGGDGFAVVLPKIASLDDPAGLARRISKAVAEPFEIAGTKAAFGVGIGIGISVTPDDGLTADDLVRRADLALYRAKAEGRSFTHFFEPAMDAYVERRAMVESELRAAVAAEQVDVHYEPLVNLIGDRIIGFEALARWHSPALGQVEPHVFLTVAEECGLIHRLGDQLLRAACREAMNWPDDFTLAFKISPLQLRNATMGLRVLGILGETGLPPARLELEITESAIVSEPILAQRLIDELRAARVRIALRDFGTGRATMSQLLSLRFDRIKIDRSFVSSLGSNQGSRGNVRAIIGLAQGLGLTTAAEGIETPAQLADLKSDGCAEGQGHLFSKAIPASQIPALLRQPSIAEAVA